MAKLKVGDKAPELGIIGSNEEIAKLKDFKGSKIVLYFYPKDSTPGCTVEACGFRDQYKKIEKQNAVILGVSPDGLKSHEKFIDKYSLPFVLLSDEDKKVCKAYGVWVKKKMYGREYMGVARQTFIIDEKGKIEKIYEKVSPKVHDAEVLEYLKTGE